MNKIEMRVRVLLTMQVALLGMVTSKMHAVLTSWNEKEIVVRILFEGVVSPLDEEIASEIESEILSHFPIHSVSCRAESCLASEKIVPSAGEVVVFQRALVHR